MAEQNERGHSRTSVETVGRSLCKVFCLGLFCLGLFCRIKLSFVDLFGPYKEAIVVHLSRPKDLTKRALYGKRDLSGWVSL